MYFEIMNSGMLSFTRDALLFELGVWILRGASTQTFTGSCGRFKFEILKFNLADNMERTTFISATHRYLILYDSAPLSDQTRPIPPLFYHYPQSCNFTETLLC